MSVSLSVSHERLQEVVYIIVASFKHKKKKKNYLSDFILKRRWNFFSTGGTMAWRPRFGVPPPPAYLSLSMNDDAILKGINFASGEAEKLCNNALYLIGLGMEVSIKLLITTSFSSFKKFHLLSKMKSDR